MERTALDRGRLERELLRDGSTWTRVEVVARTQSTNADVAQAARRGAAEGLVVTAEHQVAGRGRLGRAWLAPARSGLVVSALVRPTQVAASSWPWLPLLTGVAVAAALTEATGIGAGLKWPNDVVVAERKLAGILVERVETSTAPAAVIGIGINVDQGAGELPGPEATSLALAGAPPIDRTVLLVEVLRTLSRQYESWRHHGGATGALRAAYEDMCTTLGRQVRATLPDGSSLVGMATGIDDAGRLLVDTGSRSEALGAGEVVHVRTGS